MNSYVEKIIKSDYGVYLNDERCIITDRMGNWGEHWVRLAWEGYWKKEVVSLSTDEVEFLFSQRFTQNVSRRETGELYQNYTLCDARYYPGAIVCGILAPSAEPKIRKEIVDYAKKVGYIAEKMTPVVMSTGTKSLLFNEDGTYSIFFKWNDEITQKIDREFLINFTKTFFRAFDTVEVQSDGVLVRDLSEEEVFSRSNIDTFRVYDIWLLFVSPEINKKLLLEALIKIAYMDDIPGNLLRWHFKREKVTKISLPEEISERIIIDEAGERCLKCGVAYHDIKDRHHIYKYKLSVPYAEAIRKLIVDTEELLKAELSESASILFSKFDERVLTCFKDGKCLSEEQEQEKQRERLSYNSFHKCHLKCGAVYHDDEDGFSYYNYTTTVPYSEPLRELLINAKKTIRAKAGDNAFVEFYGYRKGINVDFKSDLPYALMVESELVKLDNAISHLQSILNETSDDSSSIFRETLSIDFEEGVCDQSLVEGEILSLDYAIYLMMTSANYNEFQFYDEIFSLLELDEKYKEVYMSYYNLFRKVFPEKNE